MRKKRIVINTDFPLIKTGLAKNGRHLAEFLHKSGKYEIFYYSCGMTWDHPEYDKLPFECHGALPNSPQEIEMIKRHGEPIFRMACYGAHNVDKVIADFKPDVFITSNDTWASTFYLDKSWLKEITYIPHKTYDSLPFLPDQKEYFKKAKKVYVWADFAKEEANKLGFDNVEVLRGIIDHSSFKRLSFFDRIQLRRKNNLPEDAFIVVKCSRNQIRKQFKSVLEGYAKWKKMNPSAKKSYLLFHTNFSEAGGWDFNRFCEDLQIPKEELLTTYYCSQCREYEVKPFTGNDKDCRFCGSKKTQHNINIQLGPDEEQLNEIYNLADCMVHGADAAGLEITCVEGLCCELPLATNPYAALTTFTNQDFVYSIDCSYGVQLGTQFNRAVLNPNDIAKFIQKIYEMPLDKRSELGKRGRKWAIETFSPEVVCKQWERIIDEAPFVDWENLRPVHTAGKNPSAIIPEIEDNLLWVRALYKLILDLEPPDDDSGVQYWVKELEKGAPRDQIENYFKNEALKEKQVSFEELLLTNGKKNVLVMLKESIGDIIISTSVLPQIRESYPAELYNIYYACDPQYFELLDLNPNIDKTLPYQPWMENEITCTGSGKTKGFFDHYISLGVFTQKYLNYLTNNHLSIKL